MKLIVAIHSDSKELRMSIHKNARLTPRSREILVHRVLQLGEPVCGIQGMIRYFMVEQENMIKPKG